MKKERLDILFKTHLKDLKASPSPKVWQEIAKNLPAKKKKRRGFLWLPYGTAAAVFLLVTTPYFFNNYTINNSIEKIHIPSLESPYSLETVPNFTLEAKKQKKTPAFVSGNKTLFTKAKKLPVISQIKNKKTFLKKQLKKKDRLDYVAVLKNKTEEKIIKKETVLIKTGDESIQKKVDIVAFTKTISSEKNKNLPKKVKKPWSVTPSIAFLQLRNTSRSSIDSRFNGINIIGNTSTSLGITIGYQFTKKWRISSGIHKTNLQYITRDISVIPSISATGLGLENVSKSDVYIIATKELNETVLFSTSSNSTAEIQQQFGYIEVPFEVNYTFFSSKNWQAELQTGISTLFSNRNQVSLETGLLSENLGKATSLNDFSFSSNFGVQLEYQIAKDWSLVFLPKYKLHWQTFSNNSNSTQPSVWALYSGLKFSF